MDRFEQRRDKLRRKLRAAEVNALLVTNFQNVTYLTGFTGDDSYLLLTGDGAVVLSDARYTTQLEEECPGLDLSIRKPGVAMPEAVSRAVLSAKLSRLGVEGASMTLALHGHLAEKLPGVEFVTTSGMVEALREIKDAEEIEEIRRAIWYAEKGFAVLRATLSPDRTEREVAHDLENQMRKFGAAGCSFPPIIAVGPRSALPHARPTEQKIGDGDFVLVDWGAQGRLYKSDLTRILTTGRISPKLERIYGVVLKAQLSAIDAIRPGVTASEVDEVARQSIAKAGFGPRFGHSLGHGIGLDIHEAPRLGANQNRPLRPGMVVTVEPGVYLPGWGGVRIEDDVLVTKGGHEVLTSVPKTLEDTLVR